MKRLIFHCDDYGMSAEKDEAVDECIENGVTRSVSVVANAEHSEACAALKQRFGERISIGLHVNLTAGEPIVEASRVPSLVDADGRLFEYAEFRRRSLAGRIRTADIEHEVLQQALELQRHVGAFSHFDTHKHTHVLPQVTWAISRVARRLEVERIRSNARFYLSSDPDEAGSAALLLRRLRRNPLQLLSVGLKQVQRRIIARNGLRSPDGMLTFTPRISTSGFDAYEETWVRLLGRVPEGTYEINFHPGGIPIERRLLQSESLRSAIESNDISVISYHDI